MIEEEGFRKKVLIFRVRFKSRNGTHSGRAWVAKESVSFGPPCRACVSFFFQFVQLFPAAADPFFCTISSLNEFSLSFRLDSWNKEQWDALLYSDAVVVVWPLHTTSLPVPPFLSLSPLSLPVSLSLSLTRYCLFASSLLIFSPHLSLFSPSCFLIPF